MGSRRCQRQTQQMAVHDISYKSSVDAPCGWLTGRHASLWRQGRKEKWMMMRGPHVQEVMVRADHLGGKRVGVGKL